MFDLAAESAQRPLGEHSVGSGFTAILAHVAVLAALIAVPVSRAINVQPEVPTIQAFVLPREELRPPRPPAAPRAASPPATKSAAVMEPPATPREAPTDIQPEPTRPPSIDTGPGAAGGIDGGGPGGVIGGIAGGIGAIAPVLPPADRSPSRSAPLRTSGAIKPPDLLYRVEPVYSAIAVASQLSGIVILEAVVGVDGSVESVKVVRSGGPILDKSATEALKQWKYAALVIADLPTPFVATVTFTFRFPGVRGTNGT